MASRPHIEARPQGETTLDPGNPVVREPRGAGRMGDPINPHDAAAFLEEAFAETLAGMSHQAKADLAREILARRECDWAHALSDGLIEHMRDSVHDVRAGYAPAPREE